MSGDIELLRRYVDARSEAAFAELVRLHLKLVYFAALRQVGGDAHRAQEVAQTVFTDLARKAATLTHRPTLTGWLHTSTRFAAAKVRRAEFSRQKRDQEAEIMHALLHDDSAAAGAWERLRPLIDDVIHELSERDREAVLLRYFEGRAFAEIGATLALSEDAARMRVERALEKLRVALVRRGVASTTGALAVAFANQVGAALPAGLPAAVTSAALAGAAGGAVATSTATFLGGAKLVSAMVSIAVVGGAAAFVWHRAATPPPPAMRPVAPAMAAGIHAAEAPGAISTVVATTNPAVTAERTEWRSTAELTQAGQATPRAAFETLLLAMTESDLAAISRAVVLGSKGRERAEAALARLPEEGRARFSPAEKFLALKLLGNVPVMLPRVAAIRILRQTELDRDHAALRVQLQETTGLVHEEDFQFERSPDGWRLRLPEK